MASKRCTKCGNVKDAHDFHKAKRGKHGRDSVCRSCKSNRQRQREAEYWRIPENKARKKASSRKSYLKNRVKTLERCREYRLQKLFGLSVDEYDELLSTQGGVCRICGRPPGKKRLSVDHDHATGRVRGLLCSQCNQMLGLGGDDPTVLEMAARYLRENGIE